MIVYTAMHVLSGLDDTYVSSYYRISEEDIRVYLDRKGFNIESHHNVFSIQECMFCPKPTGGRRGMKANANYY